MDSPWHGFLIEVGSKSILGPIFVLIFCSICAPAGTFQARNVSPPKRGVRLARPTKSSRARPVQVHSLGLLPFTTSVANFRHFRVPSISGRRVLGMKCFCHQSGHKGVAAEKGPRQHMPPGGVRWGCRSAGRLVAPPQIDYYLTLLWPFLHVRACIVVGQRGHNPMFAGHRPSSSIEHDGF